MRSKSLRGAVISAIVGSMFLATGCLGGKWFDRIVTDALLSGAYELIWDGRGERGEAVREINAAEVFNVGNVHGLAEAIGRIPGRESVVQMLPLLHLDLDLGGARVQGVLQQLLHHRGGPLHHLAGGDLVDQLGFEWMDAHVRSLT